MLKKKENPRTNRPHHVPRISQPVCRQARRVSTMLAGGINIPMDRSGSVVQVIQRLEISRCKPRQPNAARKAIVHQIARGAVGDRPVSGSGAVISGARGTGILSSAVATANPLLELMASFPRETLCSVSRRVRNRAIQRKGSILSKWGIARRFLQQDSLADLLNVLYK